MSGKNSVWEGLMLTQTEVLDSQDYLNDSRLHVFDFLHEFYTAEDLEPVTSSLRELRLKCQQTAKKRCFARNLEYLTALRKAEFCALSSIVAAERLKRCVLEAAKLVQLNTDAKSALAEANLKVKADYASSESRQAQNFIKAFKGRFNERS